MITFRKVDTLLLLEYLSDHSDPWAHIKLQNEEGITLKNTFFFSKKDLYQPEEHDLSESEYDEPLTFKFAQLLNDYYKIDKENLGIDFPLFIHKDISIDSKYFTAISNISVFKKINEVIKDDMYIGGNHSSSLPFSEFKNILKNFPNTYEIKKYINARLSSVLRNYFDSVDDHEQKYNNYMNKKPSKKVSNLSDIFKQNELTKYLIILEKLEEMIKNENAYTEKQWQHEILQIILLLYPKYIRAFTEAPVKDTYRNKNRSLDFLLVDSTGNVDIAEIKRPFDKCIVTKNTYRDNHIPLRELSGTVMQIEKYIYHLTKWGKRGEDILTNKYKDKLPDGFKIKITNPSAIIIMGREIGLSSNQQEDFEVIKRKYKNIIDIITYDDLIKRLKFTVEQFKI
jgi:hypothetical protein